MKKNQNFVDSFNRLGENWSIDTNDTVLATLEKYTCEKKSMNVLRTKLFEKKYTKEGKVIHMCLLPPCNSVLILHINPLNASVALI